MIGQPQTFLFSLSLMGFLLPTFAERTQYLRRKMDFNLPEKCTPLPISSNELKYNSKLFVLLVLDGSGGSKMTEQNIQSFERTFVDAYGYVTPCDSSFGAERYIESAKIVDGFGIPTNNYNPAVTYNIQAGTFTLLVEITMSCNSCGNKGPWQLFEGTQVGLPVRLSSTTLNENSCVCDGPVKTDFLEKIEENKNIGDINILKVTQIQNLVSPDGTYSKECTTKEVETIYTYDGVCPRKPTE